MLKWLAEYLQSSQVMGFSIAHYHGFHGCSFTGIVIRHMVRLSATIQSNKAAS